VIGCEGREHALVSACVDGREGGLQLAADDGVVHVAGSILTV
jgi:hypothetical protein